MAEEETTTEQKQEEAPKVDDAKRYKAEMKRWRERAEARDAELADIRSELDKRKAAEDAEKLERQKKAGDFEAIEQRLTAQMETEKKRAEALAARVQEYESHDAARLESILKDREDADDIRTDFEGLPIRKQLALAEKYIAKADAAAPPAPTGQPGSLGGGEAPSDLKAEAARIYPDDEAKQKIYIEQRQLIAKERKEKPLNDGWPVQTPAVKGGF